MKPFLQKQAFEQQQWWVCIGALTTGTDLIVPHQNRVYVHPVNGFVNVGKACLASGFVHGIFEDKIGKGWGVVNFFESHIILQVIEMMEEVWHKTVLLQVNSARYKQYRRFFMGVLETKSKIVAGISDF